MYLFFFLAACGDASRLADVLLRVWRSVLAVSVFSKRLCAGPKKTTSLFMLCMDSGVLQCRFFFFCALIALRPVLM